MVKPVIGSNIVQADPEADPAVLRSTVDDTAKPESASYIEDTQKEGISAPTVYISPEENKRLRRKAHTWVLPLMCLAYMVQALDKGVIWVLPLMCLAYMVQALDKGVIGPASIMGWLPDINAEGQDYALTSTILWIGIIAGEPIANQLIRRWKVAKILAIAMFIWSALLVGMTFSFSVPPVLALRFLLGFTESCFGPCLLTITVQWYLKSEQPVVQAIWQSMLGAAVTIIALLAYGFFHVEYSGSGLRGWQWLFLTVGIISFTSSFLTWFFLPDSVETARFATADEKIKFVERVRSNNQGTQQKEFKRYQMWEALTDPFTWLLFFLAVFNTLVVGGLGTFNNLLINRSFGFDVLTSQLLSIPLSVASVCFYGLFAWSVTRWNQTLYTIMAFSIINIAGTIVLITVPPNSTTRGGLIVAFYLMQAFQACNPATFLMLSRNSAGQTKKSITYAITYMGWAGGNAIAPQLFVAKWAPRYINTLYIHIGLYAAFITTCAVMRFVLVRRNNAKIAAQTMADGTVANNNEHAFEDLTDLENPDFRYSF